MWITATDDSSIAMSIAAAIAIRMRGIVRCCSPSLITRMNTLTRMVTITRSDTIRRTGRGRTDIRTG